MPSLLGPIDALESAASSSDTAPVKRQEVSQLSLSEAGLDFIKRHERAEVERYPDSADKPTIGYGHQIWRDEAEDFRHPIDENIARQLLAMDVEHAENAVHRYAKGVSLSQHEYDALVSFVFNVGGGHFASSSVLKQLKAEIIRTRQRRCWSGSKSRRTASGCSIKDLPIGVARRKYCLARGYIRPARGEHLHFDKDHPAPGCCLGDVVIRLAMLGGGRRRAAPSDF